jgi:hypothetical protein
VRYARLADQDELLVGTFRIRVRCVWTPPQGGTPPSGQVPQREVVLPPAEPLPAAPLALVRVAQPERALPVRAEAASAADALGQAGSALPVMALINQFGALQQQMFEQFQQAMLVLSQMFSTLQQDQMQVIREELNQLRGLTEELQALKSELAAAHPSAGSVASAAANGNLPAPGAARQLPAAPGPAKPSPSGGPAPAAPPAPPGAAGAAAGAPDVHAWLCQRLAAIQEERQSRWQKILTFLSGKGTGEPTG